MAITTGTKVVNLRPVSPAVITIHAWGTATPLRPVVRQLTGAGEVARSAAASP